MSLYVSPSRAISTESWLFLADSPAGELWMRWKAHNDIWLIKYHAKMPLKVWYSSLGQKAFLPHFLPKMCDTTDRRWGREGGRQRELYHRGGWTGEIWGRQWGWQTNSHGHWGQPVWRSTVWPQIISCYLTGLLQHVQRQIPQRPKFSVTWRHEHPVSVWHVTQPGVSY